MNGRTMKKSAKRTSSCFADVLGKLYEEIWANAAMIQMTFSYKIHSILILVLFLTHMKFIAIDFLLNRIVKLFPDVPEKW